jgi:hypothetical protein
MFCSTAAANAAEVEATVPSGHVQFTKATPSTGVAVKVTLSSQRTHVGSAASVAAVPNPAGFTPTATA